MLEIIEIKLIDLRQYGKKTSFSFALQPPPRARFVVPI